MSFWVAMYQRCVPDVSMVFPCWSVILNIFCGVWMGVRLLMVTGLLFSSRILSPCLMLLAVVSVTWCPLMMVVFLLCVFGVFMFFLFGCVGFLLCFYDNIFCLFLCGVGFCVHC